MGFDARDHFPESEIEEFEEIFNLFDTDKGGSLEADELRKVRVKAERKEVASTATSQLRRLGRSSAMSLLLF